MAIPLEEPGSANDEVGRLQVQQPAVSLQNALLPLPTYITSFMIGTNERSELPVTASFARRAATHR